MTLGSPLRRGTVEDAPILAELVNYAGKGMRLCLWGSKRAEDIGAWSMRRLLRSSPFSPAQSSQRRWPASWVSWALPTVRLLEGGFLAGAVVLAGSGRPSKQRSVSLRCRLPPLWSRAWPCSLRAGSSSAGAAAHRKDQQHQVAGRCGKAKHLTPDNAKWQRATHRAVCRPSERR